MPLSVACVASKVCQFGDCRTDWRMRGTLVSSHISVTEFVIDALHWNLRLKPYLVVKISSDIVTEPCCPVCLLSVIFCRSDCRLCADMVSDCAICGNSLENHVVWLNLGRPTWDIKIFFTFDFYQRPFWLTGVVIACVSVCVSVCQLLLVRMITHKNINLREAANQRAASNHVTPMWQSNASEFSKLQYFEIRWSSW